MKAFWRGVVTGIITTIVLILVILVFRFFHNRDKQIYEYMEQQHEIQSLQEDYGNREPYEFLDDIPGVRRAADRGIERINRKRDEILQRNGSRGND
jgi:hypothetical protein